MLYYTILYYTILYYTILYYTILYYTILYYTILYNTILLSGAAYAVRAAVDASGAVQLGRSEANSFRDHPKLLGPPAPPNYPLRNPKLPSNRDHEALNSGTLGGSGPSGDVWGWGLLQKGFYLPGFFLWFRECNDAMMSS